jgi:multiple sugar transport system substrate-binding protein
MKKGFSLTFSVLLIASVLLSACAPAATQAPTTAPAQAETPETVVITQEVKKVVTPTAEPTAEPQPLSGEITLSSVQGAMIDFMNTQAQAFMDANPGVKVNVIPEPEGGAFEALIAAGNQPDIVVGSFGYMVTKYAAMDALVPLEDMPGAEDLFAELDPTVVKEYYGLKYYVPAGIDITAMIYNKDLFTEAGLDPETPPATMDEFLADAEAIQKLPARDDGNKVYGTVFWNDALAWGGWYWNMLQPLYLTINQNQCDLLNRIGADVVFDQPDCKMADFFSFAKDAQQYAPLNMQQTFFSRSIGMWLQYGYSWMPNLKDAKDQPMEIGKDVAVAPIPVVNEGDTPYTTLGGRPYMILKTTPEREALAWEFIKFMMTDENNLAFDKELGYLPVKLSLQQDEYFQAPERKVFVDLIPNAVFPPAFSNFDSVANEVLKVYNKAVVTGSITPDQAVEEAAAAARDVIAK